MLVYVLQSADDCQYVGISADPTRRLKDHNRGHVHATKTRKPWMIVYQEECANRLAARKREKYRKSGAGRRFRSRFRGHSSAG